MASQLDTQYELNRVADRKLKRAEADLVEMEDRLRRAECRLPAGDLAQLSHERVSGVDNLKNVSSDYLNIQLTYCIFMFVIYMIYYIQFSSRNVLFVHVFLNLFPA